MVGIIRLRVSTNAMIVIANADTMGVRKVSAAANTLVILPVQTVLAQGLEAGHIEKAQQSVLFAIVRVTAGCIVLRKREDTVVFVVVLRGTSSQNVPKGKRVQG